MKLFLPLLFLFYLNLSYAQVHNLSDKIALSPCPNSPNCVSTKETRKRKRMQPIPFTESADAATIKLERLLAKNANVTLIKKDGNYLLYAFKTKIGKYIDDVEFVIDAEQKVIHFRSASRKGYGDFGKNRRRMKGIKRAMGNS